MNHFKCQLQERCIKVQRIVLLCTADPVKTSDCNSHYVLPPSGTDGTLQWNHIEPCVWVFFFCFFCICVSLCCVNPFRGIVRWICMSCHMIIAYLRQKWKINTIPRECLLPLGNVLMVQTTPLLCRNSILR